MNKMNKSKFYSCGFDSLHLILLRAAGTPESDFPFSFVSCRFSSVCSFSIFFFVHIFSVAFRFMVNGHDDMESFLVELIDFHSILSACSRLSVQCDADVV